ncbi:helix-turn-helix transcriptional regulator [Burkholderia aenigmatica]|nr:MULTISPECIES: helix-turn-helix transcriptional regulator [Burkholderia]UKD13280.1 helix-turn-helix transcriptional regulator [Burkholderia aenigmatica]
MVVIHCFSGRRKTASRLAIDCPAVLEIPARRGVSGKMRQSSGQYNQMGMLYSKIHIHQKWNGGDHCSTMRTRPNLSPDEHDDAMLAVRVGSAIAERRRARGLTQAKLAEMIGLEQEAISRWERGTRAPTLYRLQQLSDVLDCSVDQLLQRGLRRADDQLSVVAASLGELREDERVLVVNFVQQFADMLRARRPEKARQRKS